MFRLARFLKNYKKQLVIGPLFKLTEAVFELIVPLCMAAIIDVGIGGGDTGYIWRMGGIMAALAAVGLCCALVCQVYASAASQGVGTELRTALYAHILTLSGAETDRLGASSRAQRMTGDINAVQLAVAMLIRLVIRAPFLAIGAVVMAFTIDSRLALILLAAVPLISLVLYLIMSRSVPFFSAIQKKLDKIALITRENLSGARVIRAFSSEEREERRFSDSCDDHAATAVRVGRLSALLNPVTSVIMNLGILLLLRLGALRVDSGSLTQGQLIALVNYMNQILLALIVIANVVVIFTKASASAARINEVFDIKPSVVQPSEPLAFADSVTAVEFDNVSFGYGGGDVLRDISFTVNAGENIGIIGGTGSGKSTLAALIERFYDVSGGAVRVFGTDVRSLSFDALRGAIGLVPQKAALISGTVASNLRMGAPEADDERLLSALHTAQADFVLEKPGALESRVEQYGRNFSGGQRQRLTIARALAQQPRILILDDSASALDAATDAALRSAIASELDGVTVITISQRVSGIRRCDRIFVMDDGALAGVGTHAELYKNCGVYREICQSQGAGEENA